MEKETLTIDMIKKDCRVQFKNSIRPLPIILSVLTFFLVLFIYFLFCTNIVYIILTVLLVICTLLLNIGIAIATLISALSEYCIVKNKKIRIVKDQLIGLEEKVIHMSNSFVAAHNRPHILHFASYGEYSVPIGQNYNSAKIYNLDDDGIFNYCKSGDEFYLILNEKEKILAAYGCKLFELHEECV